MADIDLTDEFCAKVSGFLSRAQDMQTEAQVLTLCRARLELSFYTQEYPGILQARIFDVPSDSFSEGREIVEKLDRLMKTCHNIGFMSARQADIAGKKLDRIERQLGEYRDGYAPEGSMDILLLDGEDDYRSEIAELPFESLREIMLRLRQEIPDMVVDRATVSWRADETGLTLLRAAREMPKPL